MNNVERLVLEMIGEDPDNPDVFTDDSTGLAQIRDSINDAIQEIAMLTGGYKDEYFLPLRADRCFYRFDLKDNFIAWVADARLQSRNYRLEQTDLHRLRNFNPRWLHNNGYPRAYFPIGLNYIGFWPFPSNDGEIVRLHCAMIPVAYNEDQARIFVRRDLEYAAAHFAIGEYYASRGDAQSAMMHHGDYMKVLGLDMPYDHAAERVYQVRTHKEPWPVVSG